MKKLLFIICILLTPAAANAATAHVSVNGLVCAFCAKGIEESFGKKEEVKKIDVNLEDKLVTIDFKDGKNITDDEIKSMLENSGYSVTNIHRQ
jgi:mercuric ion binding protein